MSCPSCASQNEAEFTTEMMIHFSGLMNMELSRRLGIPTGFDLSWIAALRGSRQRELSYGC